MAFVHSSVEMHRGAPSTHLHTDANAATETLGKVLLGAHPARTLNEGGPLLTVRPRYIQQGHSCRVDLVLLLQHSYAATSLMMVCDMGRHDDDAMEAGCGTSDDNHLVFVRG